MILLNPSISDYVSTKLYIDCYQIEIETDSFSFFFYTKFMKDNIERNPPCVCVCVCMCVCVTGVNPGGGGGRDGGYISPTFEGGEMACTDIPPTFRGKNNC